MSTRIRARALPKSARYSVIAVVAALALGLTLLFGSAATAAPGPSQPVPADKVNAPANINPDKHPVTDPAQIKPEALVPMTRAQAVQQAKAWVAEKPNERIACMQADGSLAGVAQMDRIDPSRPPTAAAMAQVCSNGFPGSRP
jgi:hypothetical protein